MKQTTVLVVLDGWGIGPMDGSNPIYRSELATINYLQANFPCGALQASGMSVGLPYDEEGNSEVGHMTMGVGRVFWEHFPRISLSIKYKNFFENKAILQAFNWAKEKKSDLHLVGLLTEANVHSSLEVLEALIKMAGDQGVENFYLHIFSDGRDSAPESVKNIFGRLVKNTGLSLEKHLASISGRYYAMDRDKHWDRTKKTYDVLVGNSTTISGLDETVERTYLKNLNDEYIEPTAIGEPHPIKDNDAVIFFNFREDRMRQIVRTFVDPEFKEFPVKKFQNLCLVTMISYDSSFKVPVAFPEEKISECLGEVLSKEGKVQLRIAETEKYAHVTYFFNGLREDPFPNEYRILIPSQNAVHYEEHPEMMAKPITDRVLAALSEGTFDFILVNYANPDMVAHTGNYEATMKAVKIIDGELKRIVENALPSGHTVVITSDHGNAEVLLDLRTGEPETKHDPNPVPLYLVSSRFKRKNPRPPFVSLPVIGMLSDVAPTILDLMKIAKPKEMNGQSLLPELLQEF